MDNRKQEIIESYGFRFLDELEQSAVRMMGLGRETRCLESYHWDNRCRPEGYLFQYTVSGKGFLKVDGVEHAVMPGQGFLLRMPEEESYYYREENGQPWSFYYILFQGKAVEPYCRYIHSRLGKLITLPEYHPAIRLLIRLFEDAREDQLQDVFTVSSRVFEFICSLCSSGTGVSRYSALVTQAKKALEESFAELNGIGALAEALRVSPSHLSREFSREMGIPLVEYQRRLRLEKAVHLLSTTAMPIGEISLACGFSCGNYFDKVFRKYLKMSPKKFREYVRREGYRNIRI